MEKSGLCLIPLDWKTTISVLLGLILSLLRVNQFKATESVFSIRVFRLIAFDGKSESKKKLSIICIHNDFGVRQMLGEVFGEKQEEERTENGTLHDSMSDTFRVGGSSDYLATIMQPSLKPVRLNTVPAELVQKAAMLNAVERFRRVNGHQRRDTAAVDSLLRQ